VNKKSIFAFLIILFTLPLTVYYLLPQATYLYIEATGQKANLVIDASANLGGLPQTWRYLAQGGEELIPDTLSPTLNHLKQLQPRYIRIDHIFDGYIDFDDPYNLDFTKLDQLVNDITSVGALPFFALSYFPSQYTDDNTVTGQPNPQLWASAIRQTIQHYSSQYPNLYYEVYNEPDLFGQWKTYSSKNYLNLYRPVSHIAQELSPQLKPFKIGGPATTALYKNWVNKFLETITKENLRLDFYSWHRYSLNPHQFTKDIETFNQWLENHPQQMPNLELFITESGPDSENNSIYDQNLAAAHALSVINLTTAKLTGLFTFEIKDGLDSQKKTHWGRWGLLTHQESTDGLQPKPRFNSLLALNQLGSDRLQVTGQGDWVTALASQNPTTNSIIVEVTNYDRYSRHRENTPITFKNLPPGNYDLTKKLLNGGTNTQIIQILPQTLFQTSLNLAPNTTYILTLTPQTPDKD
jgi:hypothetical protein